MGRQIDAGNNTGAIELLQDFQEGQSRLDRNFKDFVVRLNRHSVQAEQPCLCSKRPSLTRDQIVTGIHDTTIDKPMAEPVDRTATEIADRATPTDIRQRRPIDHCDDLRQRIVDCLGYFGTPSTGNCGFPRAW